MLSKLISTKVIITAVIGIFLSSAVVVLYNDYKTAEKRWKVSEENVKAYSEQLSNSNTKNRALHLTVDQLNYFNDSIIKKLDSVRTELGIKNKQLNSLYYIKSTFAKNDTIYLKGDTIFKDPCFTMDTIVGDKWYNIKLGLHYPSEITISPTIKSEKSIIVSTKKETVNPPKKWWIQRLFQKKQKVLQVDVVEENPYIENDNNRYIEILK